MARSISAMRPSRGHELSKSALSVPRTTIEVFQGEVLPRRRGARMGAVPFSNLYLAASHAQAGLSEEHFRRLVDRALPAGGSRAGQ